MEGDMEFEVIEVRGMHFGAQRIDADGKEFIDCTFDGTTLVYSGGAPFFIGNRERANITIEFQGAALNTLNALMVLHSTGAHEYVEHVVQRIRGGGKVAN